MTKMKKLFAVVLALAMLFTMASFSASAENTATVRMNVLSESGNLVVKISADENVGGLTATLNYDKTLVKYVGFASSNDANQEVNTLKDDGNGKVSIVLLGNKLDVKFEVIGAAGAISFTLNNIKASNADGTALLATDNEVVKTRAAATTDGNTIRDTDDPAKQDLGFVSTFIGSAVPKDATNVKLGFVAIPSNLLDGELTVDTDKVLRSEVAVTREALVSEDATLYIAHITGFADNASRMGRVICGRFYVSYELNGNPEIFYSNNTNTDQDLGPVVENGVVAKSFVGTCKAMAAVILAENLDSAIIYNATEGSLIADRAAVEDIIDGSTVEAQRFAILEFVAANAALLK